MKKTNFLFGAVAALAMGGAFTACSDDAIDNGNNKVAEADQNLYLRVAISQPTGSRATNDATNFEDGTDAENKVSAMYFKFYDLNGNPVDTQTATEYEFVDATDENPSVGKVKEAIVKIGLQKGANYPAYVMCFINPVNFDEINAESAAKMQDLRNKQRYDYKSNSGDFAMNNSVYYGNDAVSGAPNVKISGTPITADKIYATEAAAKEGESTVDIYVERYAAKVKFSIAEDAVKPYSTGNGYTLTFNPEAWTINADANSMYGVKRYAATDGDGAPIPTLDQVYKMLGGWNTWNDAPLHRSYWACSPSYYATAFPQVSDNIADHAEDGTGAGTLVGDYKLRYYSYNQVIATTGAGAGVTKFAAEADGTLPCKYVMENTMGADAFASLNPKAAAPSVLVVGNYTIANGEASIAEGTKFYLFDTNLYFDAVPATGAKTDAQTMLNKFLDINQILAVDENGTLLNSTNVADAVASSFVVEHPALAIRQQQAVPHRFVTLQLNSVPAGALYYKPNGSSVWVPVTDEVKDQVNTLLWQQLGVAYAYTAGKAYYSIPVQHLGMTENTVDESPIVDNKVDWTKVRVGDFGLVRNHVYTLGVSEISGLATGIENLDYPIVPPMDADNYWIKYRIKILNWRIVPAQTGIIL